MNKQPVSFSEIACVFLKIGAMSYGGPAIMGIMQTEIQEKRQLVDKEKFVEGLALVNLLPGRPQMVPRQGGTYPHRWHKHSMLHLFV